MLSHPFIPANSIAAVPIVATALFLAGADISIAQDSEREENLVNSTIANAPAINDLGFFDLEVQSPFGFVEKRRLAIHRANQDFSDGNDIRPVYFHRPLFSLVENPDPGECPAVFWSQCEFSETMRYPQTVVFLLALVTDGSRALALPRIVDEDSSFLSDQGFAASDVQIRQWPVTRVRASLVDVDSGDTLAAGQTPGQTVVQVGDRVQLRFSLEDYPTAEQLVKRVRDNLVEIEYEYQDVRVQVDRASRRIRITTTIKNEIEKFLEQNNLNDSAVIFQSQKLSYVDEITAQISSSTTATSKKVADLLPDVGSDYAKALFDDDNVEFEDLAELSDPQLAKVIYDHLQPILERYETTNTKSDWSAPTEVVHPLG